MGSKKVGMPERVVIPGLAQKLRQARETAGLSQVDAGEKSGVHHISIARYELEERVPTLAALYLLATAYGVKVPDLLPSDLPKKMLDDFKKKQKGKS